MKITVTAPDGAKLETTKGERNSTLLRYIQINCPAQAEMIRDAIAAQRELTKQKMALSQRILNETGYLLPNF